MATVILVRHGRTSANAAGVLAGRSAGVRLDAAGRQQAARAGERLAQVPLARIVTSPMTRCRETARAVVAAQPAGGDAEVRVERALTECDYGDWTGRPIAELAKEDLWQVVQRQPAAVTFPGGESMIGMQNRAVAAVRRLDAELEAAHGHGAIWAAVSHGDVIKSLLADALGLHLDQFQRLHVAPGSISIIRYTASTPQVLATNTLAGDLGWLVPREVPAPEAGPAGTLPRDDAVVGGGDLAH